MREILFHLESLVAGFFLWMALYIITREFPLPINKNGPVRRKLGPALSMGIFLMLISWYMLGVIVGSMAQDKETTVLWVRLTFWTGPIVMMLWLRAFMLLPDKEQDNPQQRSRLQQFILALIFIFAVLLAIAGTFSDFIYRYRDVYTDPSLPGKFFVPPALPQYYLFGASVIVAMWASVFIVLHRYRNSAHNLEQQREFGWLGLGTATLAFGASMIIIGYDILQGQIVIQASNLVMGIGLVLIGYSIARYSALLRGQIITQDFLRSLRDVTALVIFCLFVFHLLHLASPNPMSPASIPFLVFVVTIVYMLGPWVEWALDKWMLPDWEVRLLAQINRVRQEIVVAPDQYKALNLAQQELFEITDHAKNATVREMITTEIETIFRHQAFKNETVMGNSQLLKLNQLQRALNNFARENKLMPALLSEAEKARVLQFFFQQYIHNSFCPDPGATPPNPPSDRWVEYLILAKSYLEGKQRKIVIREIDQTCGLKLAHRGTGGRLYATHLENARKNLAQMLWQDEMQAIKN